MSSSRKFCLNIFHFLWPIAALYQPKVTASNPDILSEYYWGSPELRSQTLTCQDELLQMICFNKCGMSDMCEGNQCKCSEREKKSYHKKTLLRSLDDAEPYYYPFEDNKYLVHSNEFTETDSFPLRTSVKKEIKPEDQVTESPALRHHIAHFCPNLHEARKCIRDCMKVGKPAFCGKDHVCYCGHKYNSNDEEKPTNLNDMYAEFRDLYEKYFGPQSQEQTS